jgi:predicted aspartyl protease
MDILACMLAYLAGIGALFVGLALSFFVFFSTPHEPTQTQAQPQSASAMLVRPSAPNKPAAVEAHPKHSAMQTAKRNGGHFEKHAAAAGLPDRSARD